MNVEDVARIVHETNRAYCLGVGDKTHAPWPELKPSERLCLKEAIRHHLDNPDALPSATHERWLAERKKQGWKHGLLKDVYRKEDPAMLPFESLPEMQRVKARLFVAIVDTLRRNVRDE